MSKPPPTLDELRERIEHEVDYVDVKPYSHNIISLALMQINEGYGNAEANRAIRDFGLDDLGWREASEEETS